MKLRFVGGLAACHAVCTDGGRRTVRNTPLARCSERRQRWSPPVLAATGKAPSHFPQASVRPLRIASAGLAANESSRQRKSPAATAIDASCPCALQPGVLVRLSKAKDARRGGRAGRAAYIAAAACITAACPLPPPPMQHHPAP
ncbi:hypothetical protein CBM2634_U10055 [Cupriavidus taiwanensis]|uniref:Uncharacterized protein n=1 Tax=Cupriavidus taiwanensis TaxID=164546 RepID=A0A375JB74_9BURK|nr:hypothetical protein CBM2634_U10055 [Cupriavidus taiwanensis]